MRQTSYIMPSLRQTSFCNRISSALFFLSSSLTIFAALRVPSFDKCSLGRSQRETGGAGGEEGEAGEEGKEGKEEEEREEREKQER